MTLLDSFHAALDANPDDWTTRLVLADWLEERGEPGDEATAAAIRWQVAEKKRPRSSWVHSDFVIWFNEDRDNASGNDPMSDLPGTLFLFLESHDADKGDDGKRYYSSRRLAEEALWRAWPLWQAQLATAAPSSS